MKLTRRSAIVSPLALLVAGSLPARAAENLVFATDGIAINGTDPVGYFTQSQAVPGSPEFSLDWNGARWLFASAENRAAFEAAPEAMAPRFGGYCAFAVSRGYVAPSVPEAWTVFEDRLYLNFSTGVRRRWRKDMVANIAKAEANWPGVLG